MAVEKSLLVECPACGIENLLGDKVSEFTAVCNQCREYLMGQDLINSHTGHSCKECGMVYLLKKSSGFVIGESECQCGSSNFNPAEVDGFVNDFQPPELEDSNNIDDDFDWCRPAPDEKLEDDYNNLFDDDPGFAK